MAGARSRGPRPGDDDDDDDGDDEGDDDDDDDDDDNNYEAHSPPQGPTKAATVS